MNVTANKLAELERGWPKSSRHFYREQRGAMMDAERELRTLQSQVDALRARMTAQESQLAVAMNLVRDYYWVQSRKEGMQVDEKARLMFSLYFPTAIDNGNADYFTPATSGDGS